LECKEFLYVSIYVDGCWFLQFQYVCAMNDFVTSEAAAAGAAAIITTATPRETP